MTERRYRAVLEVEAGVRVTETAEQFGCPGRRCTGGSAGVAMTAWTSWWTGLIGRLPPQVLSRHTAGLGDVRPLLHLGQELS